MKGFKGATDGVRGRDLILLGSAVLLGFASICSLFGFDAFVFNYLSARHPIRWCSSAWAETVGLLGKGWFLVWLTILGYFVTGKQKPVVCILLTLTLVSMAIVPLKFLVMRPRPYRVLEWMRSGAEGGISGQLSFPSGDTAAAFAVATVILYLSHPRSRLPGLFSWLALATAAGVGLLRVVVMAHFPSDVLAGAGFACLAAWLGVFTERQLEAHGLFRFKINPWLAAAIWVLVPLVHGLTEGREELRTTLHHFVALVQGTNSE